MGIFFIITAVMVIPSLIRKANDNEILEVWGDGSPIRDFIHCRDVAQGMMDAIENEERLMPSLIYTKNTSGAIRRLRNKKPTKGYLSALIDAGAGTAAHRASDNAPCVTISLDLKFIGASKIGDEIVGHVKILKKTKIPFVIHHMQGTPNTMQKNPKYKNVLLDIYDLFENNLQKHLKLRD